MSTRDFALAVSVPAYDWSWGAERRSVRVDYGEPVSGKVTAFLFRSVDAEGNMLGGPLRFDIPGEE